MHDAEKDQLLGIKKRLLDLRNGLKEDNNKVKQHLPRSVGTAKVYLTGYRDARRHALKSLNITINDTFVIVNNLIREEEKI